MRKHVSLTLAVAAALTLATAASAAQDTIRKGFNVAEGGTLRLDSDIGEVTIVSGGTGVAIEVIRKATGRKGDEQLRDHHIEFKQSGNDVVIDSDFDSSESWTKWIRFSDDYEVQWNIRVPAHYNVEVKTSGGGIDLADIGGTVDARTSGGGIKTGRITGNATLKTSGGSIKVGGANADLIAHTSGGSITLARVGGKVYARTSGGGIRIEDASGSVDASTSGGSITARLSRQPQGDSRLSTSGGGVTVSIAGGLDLELDAHASGGGVTSDIPITVQGTQDDDSLRGRIGSGGPKLVLRSSGGGIRVIGL
jgi:hypothetical protein